MYFAFSVVRTMSAMARGSLAADGMRCNGRAACWPWRRSWGPAGVAGEDGFHIGEQVRLRELLVGSLVGPDRFEAQFVAILEPGGDLLDGGLFEGVGKAGGRQDVGAPRE